MTTKILDLNNIERKLFWAFSAFFVGLLAFYLYSALSLTIAGVERDQMSHSSRTLALQASDLEGEYMGIQNSVTILNAEKLGFSEVVAKFSSSPKEGASSAKLSLVR